MFQKAFTLLELLVVITIIGVLASIVVVSLSGSTSSAEIAQIQPFSHQIHALLGHEAVLNLNFNEGNYGTCPDLSDVCDASGYKNNGTIYNNEAVFIPSDIGGFALSFDGLDDYIQITSNASLKPEIITVSAWIKMIDPSLRRQLFLTKWFGYSCETDSDHEPFFRIYNGGDSPHGDPLVVGKWYHFVGVYDPSGDAEYQGNTLYINGERVGTTPNTNPIIHQDNILTIGKYSGGYHWGGVIDEVRIYAAALSSAEIRSQYVRGLGKLLAKNLISQKEYFQRMSEFGNLSLLNE
jgi:prepilin-type N-terminal cleavage/methylation domain-containing protein